MTDDLCRGCGDTIEAARRLRLSLKGKTALYCESCNRRMVHNFRRNQRRRERDQIMRDLGLTKVRGNMGGTYWE